MTRSNIIVIEGDWLERAWPKAAAVQVALLTKSWLMIDSNLAIN